MKYQKITKYKYKTSAIETIQTNIKDQEFKHDFFILKENGLLVVNSGYLWDGLSGPTWDTKSTMRAGLFHDALYQAIRLKLIPFYVKPEVDLLFYNIMIEDKVWKPRAKLFYKAVEEFGHNSCIPSDIHIPEVIEV